MTIITIACHGNGKKPFYNYELTGVPTEYRFRSMTKDGVYLSDKEIPGWLPVKKHKGVFHFKADERTPLFKQRPADFQEFHLIRILTKVHIDVEAEAKLVLKKVGKRNIPELIDQLKKLV